jgi:hypothetical protein
MAQQIQLRNDSTAGWAADNPVLAQGEIGVDTTLGQMKIGDGTSTWSQLNFYASGTADIEDFVFDFVEAGDVEETDQSRITIANHDMVIRTTRSGGQDADISLESADDVWISANDTVELQSTDDEVRIITGEDGNNQWTFTPNGTIEFPNGSVQETAYVGSGVSIPLPDFLTYAEDRGHLPTRNTNFGWNSNGLWFGNALEGDSSSSYPVFTDFTINENDAVTVEFNFEVTQECNDIGLCVYLDGDTPNWQWGTDSSRIAAQFDCLQPLLLGITEDYQGERSNIPDPGMYHVRFTYNPVGGTPVQFEYFEGTTTNTQISSLTLNETLGAGSYRVGFAADTNNGRTYISDLSIMVNEDSPYVDSLTNGDSGTNQELVAPMSILDSSGEPLINFEKSYTGTARIVAPQDDLALRSARDILLYAGEDGPGNVYIGWGNADTTPNATNRVATIGDIETAPRTYTANNEARYGTYQASGFVEVTSNAATPFTAQVYSPDGTYNVTSTTLLVDQTANDLLATNPSWREITVTDQTSSVRVLRNPSYQSSTEGGYLWSFGCDATLDLNPGTAYTVNGSYGGAPILWWDADNENPTGEEFSNSNFRGAKIEYHAYVEDSGTVIGTIYIADDSNDRNVTHMETASGGNDVGTAIFWNRSGSETELHLYRTDGDDVLHKIQWTAQMYYATEVYDD